MMAARNVTSRTSDNLLSPNRASLINITIAPTTQTGTSKYAQAASRLLTVLDRNAAAQRRSLTYRTATPSSPSAIPTSHAHDSKVVTKSSPIYKQAYGRQLHGSEEPGAGAIAPPMYSAAPTPAPSITEPTNSWFTRLTPAALIPLPITLRRIGSIKAPPARPTPAPIGDQRRRQHQCCSYVHPSNPCTHRMPVQPPVLRRLRARYPQPALPRWKQTG
jgi:hypothetical protein